VKIHAHKIASSVYRLGLEHEVSYSRMVEPRTGQVLVVRALEEKRVYDVVELTTGRMAHISKGDVLVGALGSRAALAGFVGRVPEQIKAGDVLHVLNLGGVIGECISVNQDVGKPLQVEVIGGVMRDGQALNIRDDAIPPSEELAMTAPLVMVSGSCMNSGKTRAVTEIVFHLTQRGYKVGAAKLTGVAAQRDPLSMVDHGAFEALSFLDCGVPSTSDCPDLPQVAKAILNQLCEDGADVVVAETGDGIIGSYGVRRLLEDEQIRAAAKCHVLTANDLVAAWGAKHIMEDDLGLKIGVMAGPATDNEVGVRYVEDELGITAANARTDAVKLADAVEELAFS
jgi:hypothetical protein